MNRRRFYVVGFGILMLFDTLTQVSIKLATAHAGGFLADLGWLRQVLAEPWLYAAIVGYLGAFVTWMTLLKHAPIGPAFAASHLEVVTVLIVSVLFFHEHLSAGQMLGGLCIAAGIVCLSFSEAEHPESQRLTDPAATPASGD
jgi:drug/metabolite transporter (DMT)-like permease